MIDFKLKTFIMTPKFLLLVRFLIIFIYPSSLSAQVYYGSAGSIPDNGSSNNYFYLTVSGLSPANINSTYGIEEVCIDITHSKASDLLIYLESPDGISVELTSMNGGNGSNYTNTCFSNSAATSIVNANAPFTGIFKPEGFLGHFNNGQNGNGIWRLRIHDWKAFADIGTLTNWRIKFSNNPAMPLNFTSSNLPIMIINTNGQTIVDEPKMMVDMGIIYNGPGQRNYMTNVWNNYNGKAAIELRGSSSQNFEKKSYGFKTKDVLGNNFNTPLLGMPAEHDWVLYAPYTDKSLMRNFITYHLSNEIEQYASRCRFLELIINGQYRGVYVLMEKIKADKNRVDIKKMTAADIAGDNLTGGYIIKIDKTNATGEDGWYSSIGPGTPGSNDTVYFQYYYPKDSITNQQKSYIQNYMADFESALMSPGFADPVNGYRKYIDVNSFIDHFIISEVGKNVDAYRLSTFLYKDRNSKLNIGPVWDFDLAWRNANFSDAENYIGWRYLVNDTEYPNPVWWYRFMQDEGFVNQLKCRWQQVRQIAMDPPLFNAFIDSIAVYLEESQERNFTAWPILGLNVWANPSPIPATYEGEISSLKSWVTNRVAWIDANLPGICNVNIPVNEMVSNSFKVFPNPFTSSLNGFYKIDNESNVKLELFNSIGIRVQQIFEGYQTAGIYQEEISTHGLPSGVYVLKLTVGKNTFHQKVIKLS